MVTIHINEIFVDSSKSNKIYLSRTDTKTNMDVADEEAASILPHVIQHEHYSTVQYLCATIPSAVHKILIIYCY